MDNIKKNQMEPPHMRNIVSEIISPNRTTCRFNPEQEKKKKSVKLEDIAIDIIQNKGPRFTNKLKKVLESQDPWDTSSSLTYV